MREMKEKKEREMKGNTILKASVFAAFLGVACLLPATAHAQAEISPDTYEMANSQPVTTQPGQVASNTTPAADFQGQGSLPYDVSCSGKNLKSGKYQLTVKSEGPNHVVTIARDGQVTTLQAHELPGRHATTHSALLVRKAAEGRVLAAVYVQQLNAMLFLD